MRPGANNTDEGVAAIEAWCAKNGLDASRMPERDMIEVCAGRLTVSVRPAQYWPRVEVERAQLGVTYLPEDGWLVGDDGLLRRRVTVPLVVGPPPELFNLLDTTLGAVVAPALTDQGGVHSG